MRQKSDSTAGTPEKLVRDIRRATRKQYSAEEKIRIVLEGLRGEENISELWRRLISERTKAALAMRKAQGKAHGGGMTAGSIKNRDEAKARAEALRSVVDEIKANGITSLRDIAAALNNRGIKTAQGGQWLAPQVQRVLRALGDG
jgi:transposase-like protein